MNQSITVNLTPDELALLIETSVRKVISGISQTPPRIPEPELLTIQQAAELLHLTVSTLYSYVHYRKISYLKKSGKLYFKRSTLLHWVESGHHMSTDEISQATNESLVR